MTNSTNSALPGGFMIDTPSPFAPRTELQDFLRQMMSDPARLTPEGQQAIKEVQGYLMQGKKGPDLDAARADFARTTAELAERFRKNAQPSSPQPAAPSASATGLPKPTAQAAPEAMKAMGEALVRLGVEQGDLGRVRSGRELQRLADQQAKAKPPAK